MSNKTKAIVLIIVCVLIGFVLGVVIDRVALKEIYHGEKRDGLKEYKRELVKRLNLSKEQQVRLDTILGWSQREFKKLSKEFKPKFDSLRNVVRDSIRSILTPEQLGEFEKMIKETEKNGRR
jgi:hypothetical protein